MSKLGAFVGRPGDRHAGRVVSTCIKCGGFCARGQSYCPEHRPVRDVKARGGGAQIAAFRNAVGARAGWRCEVVEHGERCQETRRSELEAHHLGGVPLHNDPARGVLACRRHHRAIEAAERKRREALAEAGKLTA